MNYIGPSSRAFATKMLRWREYHERTNALVDLFSISAKWGAGSRHALDNVLLYASFGVVV